jgi:hypothetical protein
VRERGAGWRVAEERERAQITRGIEDGALREEGRLEGRRQELREAIVDRCDLAGIAVDAERLARLETSSVEALVA